MILNVKNEYTKYLYHKNDDKAIIKLRISYAINKKNQIIFWQKCNFYAINLINKKSFTKSNIKETFSFENLLLL